jgi:excisionase family DNA binding protein
MNAENTQVEIGGIKQRYLALKQAAVYLGLAKKTLYSQASKGLIPAHKIGRVWRFDLEELDAFVHGVKPASATICYNNPPSRSGGFSRKGD